MCNKNKSVLILMFKLNLGALHLSLFIFQTTENDNAEQQIFQ